MKNLLVLTLLTAAALTAAAILPSTSTAITPTPTAPAAASPDPSVDEVAIDVVVSGNSDKALGPTEFCNATPIQVGDSMDIDIIARGVPADPPLFGIGANLVFDSSVLKVTSVHLEGPSMIGTNSIFSFVDYDGWLRTDDVKVFPPATNGNVRLDYVTIGFDEHGSGDGVMLRLTLEAVNEGVGVLALDNYLAEFQPDATAGEPAILYGGNVGGYYGLDSAYYAAISVGTGSACPAGPPTALPTEPPRPSPTPLRSPTIIPTAPPLTPIEIGIDSDAEGNRALNLGSRDECRDMFVGEEIAVDVYARGVPDVNPAGNSGGLGSFTIDISYDPEVVHVVSSDVRYMLTAQGGTAVQGHDNHPDRDGLFHIDATEGQIFESGNGVLVRLVLKAVGPGVTELGLEEAAVYGAGLQLAYEFSANRSARLAVGVTCSGTPLPTPTHSLTSTPNGTLTPIPSTASATPTLDVEPVTLTLTPTPTPTLAPTASPTPHASQPQAPPVLGGELGGGGTAMAVLVAGALAIVAAAGAYVASGRRR